jgi:hypothetical protein
VLERLHELRAAIETPGRKTLGGRDVAQLVRDVACATQTGLLLIVDELGKVLEFAAQSGGAADLYLLQEIAELTADPKGPPVLMLGLLHQAYSEYGQGLTAVERSEWEKIQGRFEDVPFAESSDQMLRVMADAIEPADNKPLATAIGLTAKEWATSLEREQHSYVSSMLPAERIAALYPLHPIAALILPSLCAKYAQNDRSLFTFLTSNEPSSLSRFLSETSVPTVRRGPLPVLPVLKLPMVYDYLVNSAGAGLVARPQFQRWAEVHGIIRDASGLSVDELAALKVVGALNLVTSSGPLRASRSLTLAALLDRPNDGAEIERWIGVLDRLRSRTLLTYRQHVDEYRIWEGSDFDAEDAIRASVAAEHRSLAEVLTAVASLPPVVAQRHSYHAGTLRYFERRYVATPEALQKLGADSRESDGVVAYWTAEHGPESPPATTADGRPLVVIAATALGPLRATALEYAALVSLDRTSPVLQTDGVARREVRQRLALARKALDDALNASFDTEDGRTLWAGGERRSGGTRGAALSDLCDQAYHRGPKLWNELINRRELTSQGARARRELIEALLVNAARPRLGLAGDGPAVSMYASVLQNTGIHREEGSDPDLLVSEDAAAPAWTIGPPTHDGVRDVWLAVEAFCLESTTKPRGIDQLYAMLEAPPYGLKRGLIPVLLAAVLVYHIDDVTVYRDGTFLPTLGGEHFELLVKQPSRFTVKHFSLAGIRLELFHELESVLRRPPMRNAPGMRNTTILSVVRPLVRFAMSLPAVTRKTKRLSVEALAVRDALISATEPDALLFEILPTACGFAPFVDVSSTERPERDAAHNADAFRRAMFRVLRELQDHHEQLLACCHALIHSAFGVRSDAQHLREDLRVRAQYLIGRVIDPRIRSFVLSAANADVDDGDWLNSMVMIIADRPSEAWTDDDLLGFELHVSDLARRFANLEALQKEAAREGREGFDARRITVTSSDGSEVHRLVWIGRDEREFIERKVEELLNHLGDLPDEHQRHAIAMALAEEILSAGRPATDLGAGVPIKVDADRSPRLNVS